MASLVAMALTVAIGLALLGGGILVRRYGVGLSLRASV
jgi:hypothetical protein